MDVPREALRLVGDPENPRLVTSRTGVDFTALMKSWARKRVKALEDENLSGFIFKTRSPSSGMRSVKVYLDNGIPVSRGVGIFARVFMEHFPLLPVEDEGRLNDDGIRENFVERIFTLGRWRETISGRRSVGNLVAFHTSHKLLILSHNQRIYREMGRLVAAASQMPAGEAFAAYETALLSALGTMATVGSHCNVLQHAMGYFKEQLAGDEKAEMAGILEAYRAGNIPLIVPVTLLKHYVRKYECAYLKDQWYLDPHPIELQLRNHC